LKVEIVVCGVWFCAEVGGGFWDDAETAKELFCLLVEFLLGSFCKVDLGGGGEVVVLGEEEGIIGG